MRGRKVMVVLILAVVTAGALSGCGFVADGPFGWGYTNSKTPITIGQAKTGSKSGKACVTSFFGMTSIGDASIDAAAKAAGIKEIYTVNSENLSVFGTYTKQCTVVTGE
jgi:hypothetical protein